MKDDEIKAVPKRRLKRVTKKEIIVRTLKDQKDHEGVLSLQEISSITGMSSHDISGHLTHLVNEGKVVRRGRGLFALASPTEGEDHRSQIGKLVKSVAARSSDDPLPAQNPVEQRVILPKMKSAESNKMVMEFLSDALGSCSDVELTIRCTKDSQGKSNHTIIELKAR